MEITVLEVTPNNTKPCLNCGKPIPTVKFDTFGRRNTRTSKFCDEKCRGQFFKKENPEYFIEYYKANPERYRKVKGEV